MTYANRTLLGGCLLTGSLGSIHAFSVFIQPLEFLLTVSRAQVSLLYSLALVCLTLAVLFGHHLYQRYRPATLAIGACVIAALGLWVAGMSQSLYGHLIGYSLLFGGANGIGYGLSLYVISRAMPERTGFGMGTVTAVYALGATLFVILFERLVTSLGAGPTFFVMAGILLVVAVAVGYLYTGQEDNQPVVSKTGRKVARASHTQTEGNLQTDTHERPGARLLVLLWLGYGFAVIAGLMAIGHAAGIVGAAGGTTNQIVRGAMLIGIGNAAGGFTAGWLIDRSPARLLLLGLSLLSGFALAAIAWNSGIQLALIGLPVIGFAYGAIIAIYPVITVIYYGTEEATKVYGRIFTAWGVAGLLGPWFAGVVYDATGGYSAALALASVAALLSIVVVLMLPPVETSRSRHATPAPP